MENIVGPVKFIMGYCGLDVLLINPNTDSPSWSYEIHVGLAISYCLSIIMANPALLLAQLKLHNRSPYD